MMEVIFSPKFEKWLKKLKDPVGYQAIVARLIQIGASGRLGDVKDINLNFSNSGTSAPEIVSSLNKLILKIPHI